MSDYVTDAMQMVRACAAPAEGLSIKAQIRQAARMLGWPTGRTKKIWYGECVIRVDEWEQLKAARRGLQRRRELADEIAQRLDRARASHPSRGSGMGGLRCPERR